MAAHIHRREFGAHAVEHVRGRAQLARITASGGQPPAAKNQAAGVGGAGELQEPWLRGVVVDGRDALRLELLHGLVVELDYVGRDAVLARGPPERTAHRPVADRQCAVNRACRTEIAAESWARPRAQRTVRSASCWHGWCCGAAAPDARGVHMWHDFDLVIALTGGLSARWPSVSSRRSSASRRSWDTCWPGCWWDRSHRASSRTKASPNSSLRGER